MCSLKPDFPLTAHKRLVFAPEVQIYLLAVVIHGVNAAARSRSRVASAFLAYLAELPARCTATALHHGRRNNLTKCASSSNDARSGVERIPIVAPERKRSADLVSRTCRRHR